MLDADAHYAAFVWITARRGDTINRIAARRGHPEWAPQILKLNLGRDVLPHPKRKAHHPVPPIPKLRNVKQTLRAGARVKLPGTMGPSYELQALAGENAPTSTGGWSNFDVVDISGRTGINRFLGYDPFQLTVPIQFQAYGAEGTKPGNQPDGGGSIDDRILIPGADGRARPVLRLRPGAAADHQGDRDGQHDEGEQRSVDRTAPPEAQLAGHRPHLG